MTEFRLKSEELMKEHRSMREAFDRLARQIDLLRETFFTIERKCFVGEKHLCISAHDRFKLEIAQAQRLGDREKTLCYEQCTPLIPSHLVPRDISNWQIKTEEEFAVFKRYFECFKPYMSRYMDYMMQEKDIFDRANREMYKFIND